MTDHPPPTTDLGATGTITAPPPTLRTIAAAVAAILGEPWTLDPDIGMGPDRANLSAPTGVALHFHRDRTRITISGSYPPDPHYSSTDYEISVARNRAPRAIAAEIVRRLLPDYLPELRAAQARAIDRANALAARTAVLARIQVLLPGSTAPHGHGPSGTLVSLTAL